MSKDGGPINPPMLPLPPSGRKEWQMQIGPHAAGIAARTASSEGREARQAQANGTTGLLSPGQTPGLPTGWFRGQDDGPRNSNTQEQARQTRAGKGDVFSNDPCNDPCECLVRYRTLSAEERSGVRFPRHPCDGCVRGPALARAEAAKVGRSALAAGRFSRNDVDDQDHKDGRTVKNERQRAAVSKANTRRAEEIRRERGSVPGAGGRGHVLRKGARA